jgi:plastocyanin
VRVAPSTAKQVVMLAATLVAVAASAPAFGADHTVSFANQEDSVPYVPSSLHVAVNDTVTFKGPFRWHPLAWNGGTKPRVAGGTSATFTFDTSGTFRYFCEEHDGMRGSVTVAGTPGNAPPTADFTAATARLRSTRLRARAATVSLGIELDEAAQVRGTIRAGKRTLARGKRSLASAGRLRLRLAITEAGRSALRRAPRVRATLVLVLRDAAGNSRTAKRKVTVRR